MAKDKGGRPTKMTEVVVNKLEEAFALGCTDVEACLYAGIHKQTLYDYQKKFPEFTDRKEELKENPVLLARTNVMEELKSGDKQTSQWYLERKKKAEFSTQTKQEITGEDGGPIALTVNRIVHSATDNTE